MSNACIRPTVRKGRASPIVLVICPTSRLPWIRFPLVVELALHWVVVEGAVRTRRAPQHLRRMEHASEAGAPNRAEVWEKGRS